MGRGVEGPEPKWNREPLRGGTYWRDGEEYGCIENGAPVEPWPSKECRILRCEGYCVEARNLHYHAAMSHRPLGAMWRCRRCGVARHPPKPSKWHKRDTGDTT